MMMLAQRICDALQSPTTYSFTLRGWASPWWGWAVPCCYFLARQSRSTAHRTERPCRQRHFRQE